MAFGRRQHNLTMLADGSVLATGGNSSGAGLVDLNHGVYAAERWDPATGAWTTLAAETATRQYHSTALLLADGRVLSSGGGICGTCDAVGYLAKNAQVFTPPYLFKADGSGELAPRPAISSAPSAAAYGSAFTVGTPEAAAIRKAGLVRLGAVTHSVNMEQRYVPLAFTAGAGSLAVTAPANANIAPPGVYMLFLVDAAGVPSVAHMVTLGGTARRRPRPRRRRPTPRRRSRSRRPRRRRRLPLEGVGRRRRDGVRHRRPRRPRRVPAQRRRGRRGPDGALRVALEERECGDLHARRAGRRRRRRDDDDPGGLRSR